MAFESIDYAISRKLVVRFKNCFHQHIQRPWFQDNFFINVRKLIFIKKFQQSEVLISTEFFYYKVYQILWPRPVPTPGPILVKFNSHDYLVILNVCWKFEVNRLNIDEVMTREWGWKERRKIKKKNNKEKTKRKQKGFRLKSETLIIRRNTTKTERSSDVVGRP